MCAAEEIFSLFFLKFLTFFIYLFFIVEVHLAIKQSSQALHF